MHLAVFVGFCFLFLPIKAFPFLQPKRTQYNYSIISSTTRRSKSGLQMTESSSSNGNVFKFSSPFLEEITTNDGQNKTALIILNSPIRNPPSPLFERLWDMSSCRICADGGANRLYQATCTITTTTITPQDGNNGAPPPEKSYVPNRIRGDLDSLSPLVQDFYQQRGSTIEQDPCQNTNDLDKCLQVLVGDKGDGFTRIFIYGAFGGRFDQEMASLQALYKWGPKFANQLYLYNDETCAFLLPGDYQKCEIRLPFYGGQDNHDDGNSPFTQQGSNNNNNNNNGAPLGEGPTCGLIPLGCRCESIRTTGLKWDLDGSMPMEFGGLVSSSNRIMQPVVTIEASHPVVFTAELLAGLGA
jgi:thiamine pyrophosphokinase